MSALRILKLFGKVVCVILLLNGIDIYRGLSTGGHIADGTVIGFAIGCFGLALLEAPLRVARARASE